MAYLEPESAEKPRGPGRTQFHLFFIENQNLKMAIEGYMVHYITSATEAVPNSVSQDQYNISS